MIVCGVSGVIVLNYGGWVLDGVFLMFEFLLAICEVFGDGVVVLFDGGICSGLDVFKVIVFGVDVVLIGCLLIYVLVVVGVIGVVYLFWLFCDELEFCMVLIGCIILEEINESCLIEGLVYVVCC